MLIASNLQAALINLQDRVQFDNWDALTPEDVAILGDPWGGNWAPEAPAKPDYRGRVMMVLDDRRQADIGGKSPLPFMNWRERVRATALLDRED